MPRKSNRGGVRTGTVGKTYKNRSDLRSTQPVRVATGQSYGQAGQQVAAQRVVPLPTAQASMAQVAQLAPPQVMPNETPFNAPTTRPGEAPTAGLPIGPGAGPEILNLDPDEDVELQLRAWYEKSPNSDLADLIAELEARNG